MARNIGYLIQPNATPTAAQAPYLARIVPTGVANDADLIADLSAEMPVTAARYNTIWREAFACAIPRLKAGESVELGCFRLVPHIEKAMACEDSAFDPESNELVVAIHLIGELAEATKGLVPTKISSAAIASLVKVSNVMDVATETFAEIHGTDEFVVLGNGVTLDGEDEYVKALDAKTGEEIAVATIVRVSKGQRGFAKFESPLQAGRMTVEVGTHGLIADEKLHVFKKPVTVLKGEPPTHAPRITSVHSGAHPELDGQVIKGSGLIVEGKNLGGARLSIAYVAPGGEAKSYELDESEYEYDAESETLIAPPDFWAKLSIDTTKNATVTVTGADGTDSREVEFIAG